MADEHIRAPADDLIALQVADRSADAARSAADARVPRAAFLIPATRPKNAEAYDLYLHSLALAA